MLPVLMIIGVVRLWTVRGPAWTQPITGPLAAIFLVAVSGFPPGELGLTTAGFWYGVSAVAVITLGYAIAVRLPVARRFFRTDYPRPRYTALVAVPLATVVFEEVAFRGVLWTLISREHGTAWATGVTAVLFGLWHLGPARPWTDALATGVAGVLLGVLRGLSGGLLTPVLAHWAADGIGVLAAARVARSRRDASDTCAP
ncbi:CPBP family intramembrane glutamic endopeptidase [Actinoplanes awajinensis]|uniref:CAAX prenyl protease 2/Lysostaphin resistance protein A-like domain-containing protein n=1 Tax=Actinoplanes awajinensis subsp. mycoplanecinus TaxID=135947 RepID=A0A101JLV2_9ACTN|nr:CPBP family intramembrane glutamic endopeptidase [Actinoplanes awajinensis]KUL29300.1 hypothetical protein ADL15_29610 [Actinoplanes awajinensis subsp. mycoplanecinus]